jgi:predicted  nucleic acid-binding Zn-ribbon protein
VVVFATSISNKNCSLCDRESGGFTRALFIFTDCVVVSLSLKQTTPKMASMPQEIFGYASYVVPIIPREFISGDEGVAENKDGGVVDDKDAEIIVLRKALAEAQDIIRSRQQQPRTLGGGYVDKILNDQLKPPADSYETENRRLLLAEVVGICGQQLGISKAELRDSVSGYRAMVKETILTREAEKSSHLEQGQAIDQILADIIEVARIVEGEKATLERKIVHLIEENDSKEKTINQLKQSLRDAVRTKALELQKVMEAHARQKAQHARELARLGRAHDDNLVDHEATRLRRDELLAQLLACRAENADLQGRLDGASRLLTDVQDQLKTAHVSLSQAREDAKRKEGELKAALAETKRQAEDLSRRNSELMGGGAGGMGGAYGSGAGGAGGYGADGYSMYGSGGGYGADGSFDPASMTPGSLSLKLGKAADENSRLKGDLGKAQGELDNLKDQLNEVRPAIDRANAARDSALLALAAANKRLESMQRELDDKDEMHKLDKSLLNRKIDELNREIDRLKDQLKLLGRQLDKTLSDHALELAALTAKHNNDLADLDNQISGLKDRNRDLAGKLDGAGGDIGSYQGELNSREKKIGDLEDDLSKERRRSGELGVELRGVKKDLDEKRKALTAAVADRDRLSGELDQAKDALGDSERQLGLLGATVDHLKGEVDRTKAKASEKSADPDAMRRLEDLARQLENANKRIGELQRELAELKRSSAAALVRFHPEYLHSFILVPLRLFLARSCVTGCKGPRTARRH